MRFLLFLFKKVLASTKCYSFLVLGDTKFKIEGYFTFERNVASLSDAEDEE